MNIRNTAITVAFTSIVTLAGCVSSSEIRLSNGTLGHTVTCIGYEAPAPSLCIKKAGEICGRSGYDIVEWVDRAHLIIQCRDTPYQKPVVELLLDFFRHNPRNEKRLGKVSNHENCAAWYIGDKGTNPPQITWAGECKNGFATGYGTAVFKSTDDAGNNLIADATGHMHDGKATGQRVNSSYANGEKIIESIGYFINGDLAGTHKMTIIDVATLSIPYRDNQINGTVLITTPDGENAYLEFVDGKFQEEVATEKSIDKCSYPNVSIYCVNGKSDSPNIDCSC